jgi:hypothetical protein
MPYQLLLMMQHDRIRVDYGAGQDGVRKVSGKEMLERKKARG